MKLEKIDLRRVRVGGLIGERCDLHQRDHGPSSRQTRRTRDSGPAPIVSSTWIVPGGLHASMARHQALAVPARDILADALGVRQRVPDAMLAAMDMLPIPVDRDANFTTALAGDPLMRRLHLEYGIQAIVFAWPQHEARYLRVSAALYNSAAEYEYLAAALGRLGVTWSSP
jgi:hypothetical protein